MIWKTPLRSFDLTHRGLIMGVLNVTPDSFSDGGQFMNPEAAAARAICMEEEGADIIDIGGESTRPGAAAVPEEEELRRVFPVIRAVRDRTACAISIDTTKAAVAAAAMEAGAEIINDVSGLHADPEMAAVAASTGAGLVLMHMQGTPRTMQIQPAYRDVIADIKESLRRGIELASTAGVATEAIALDPGIGFGKTLEHNLAILRHSADFGLDSRPVLLGVSRKSFLSRLLPNDTPAARAWATVASLPMRGKKAFASFESHDVLPNVQALRMTEAIISLPCHDENRYGDRESS